MTQHHGQEGFRAERVHGPAVCATPVAMGGMARSIAICIIPHIVPAPA